MGRGNARVSGEYEGLYFVNWNNFSTEWVDGNEVLHTEDYEFQREEWEDALCQFISDFTQRYASFSECDKWLNNTERAVLENGLFFVAVEDNEWSIAVKLIQKEQDYYSRGNFKNLQAGLYKKYLEGMKTCLFEQFDELGTYCGAWTHSTIRKIA